MEDFSQGYVLWIDDTESHQGAEFARAFEHEGIEVRTATSADAAMQMLEESADVPRLIVLDLCLPLLDGLAFCRRVADLPSLAQVPTVLVSSDPSVDRYAAFIGADEGVRLPVDPPSAQRLIQRLLAIRSAARSAATLAPVHPIGR